MRFTKAFTVVALVMLVLDLFWLGIVAKPIYDAQLGPLRAKETVALAAGLFYVQYVLIIVFFAVLPTHSIKEAATRGLGIGWVAYATYELTNWAVIEGWPASLVLIDITWGLFLTSLVAALGRWSIEPPSEEV